MFDILFIADNGAQIIVPGFLSLEAAQKSVTDIHSGKACLWFQDPDRLFFTGAYAPSATYTISINRITLAVVDQNLEAVIPLHINGYIV